MNVISLKIHQKYQFKKYCRLLKSNENSEGLIKTHLKSSLLKNACASLLQYKSKSIYITDLTNFITVFIHSNIL